MIHANANNKRTSPPTIITVPSMKTTIYERVDLTPKQSRHSTQSLISNRSGSPLKQEVFASSDLDYHFSSDLLPQEFPTLSRNNRAFDQTHRWTVLAREAEADEVSILSVTSEEKGYFTSLLPDEPPPKPSDAHELPGHSASRPASMISGFNETAFVEHKEAEKEGQEEGEGSAEPFSEVDYDETIQFSAPSELPPFIQLPPSEPPPDDHKYIFYPLPIPKQLMLPPKLTGPHATNEIPPITTFRPQSLPPAACEHANDILDSFLDTHIEALQDDPDVVLQTEFDSNTLLGTLMNNLRDQKQEIKGRAITNEHYVVGGKSLLELDQEAVRRMQMGKALSSRGGRNWGSSHVGSSSPRRTSHGGSPYEDQLFESVSLAEMEYIEQDEDVPLAMVRNRIVTQRKDAEESLVDRIKRLKEEKKQREAQEGETLVERLARLKMEQGETLQERRARLKLRRSIHIG